MSGFPQPAVSIPGTVDISDRVARILGRPSRGISDSLVGGGRVVAPGAGVAIASTPAGVAGGVYEIWVDVAIGAGGVALDAGNMQLQEGGTVLAVIGVPAPGNAGVEPIRRTNVGNGAYSVNAVGAATATVPYSATVVATRVE